EISGRFALRDFGVERRPFRTRLAALEAEADLLAGAAAIARLAVDRHPSGVHFLVAELFGAGLKYLEVVVARQSRNAVGASDTHLVFGLGVPRLHFGERDRPVQKVGAGHIIIGAPDLEFVLVEAQRGTSPMYRRAADRLDDPRRQGRKILRDPPGARSGARIGPGDLGETVPLVIDEIVVLDARTGLENDDLDTLLRQLIAERATARARADNHDDAAVILIEFCPP